MAGHFGADAFMAARNVSRETRASLEKYEDLLRKWQRAINLVSKSTLDDVWRRHFLDSAQVMDALPDRNATILDIGTGAGFPGMVLAMLGAPNVTLVDSDQRKCQFLREVSRETSTGVTIHAARIEDIPSGTYDVVVSRACAPLDVLLEYAQPYLHSESCCLFLKGRSVDEELTTAKKHWIMRSRLIPSVTDSAGALVRLEGISDDPGHGE